MVMVNYIRKMVHHTLQTKEHLEGDPCTVFKNESNINAWWLVAHAMALCKEYTHRYGKVHSCEKYMKKQTILFHLPR